MKTQAIRRETDYLEVFQEVTRLTSGIHDPQKVMDLVVERLPVLLEVDAATIRLLDSSTNTFVIGAAWGVSEEYLSRATIDTREVMNSILKGRPVARTDVDSLCDHDSCSFITREGVKSALSLPIVFKERVVGLLRLLTRSNRKFSRLEINFAMSLAEQVGVAIVNGTMFRDMENQARYFNGLGRISRCVNATYDLKEITSKIVNELQISMGVRGCTLRLLDPATNRFELAASVGVSRRYLQRGGIEGEDSLLKVLKGEPVAIYDAVNDPRVDYHQEMKEEGIRSILAIPISNGKQIIGVLRLLSDSHRLFTSSEIHFAAVIAEEGGNAIQKARTHRKITLLFNQIEEQERFLQTIFDSLWVQILVIDRDMRVVMANRTFLERHGHDERNVLGLLYDAVSPWSTRGLEKCPVGGVLENTTPVTALLEYNSKGEKQWLERRLFPILDDTGRVDFVIEAVRDITSEKQLELEKLERMKFQGVLEMAGTAAHELNSPLFAALGTAQLLRDDMESEEMINEVDTIIRNLKRMADLTRKMHTVTGYETKGYVGNTRIVSLKSEGSHEL